MNANETKTQSRQHTSGPWTSDRRGRHGVANYTVIGTPSNFHTEIARVYHGDRFSDGEANARLIAAAPDLLEALRSCVSILPRYRGAGEFADHDEELEAVLESAWDAIAKVVQS